jgi:hypothetical protein
MPPLLPAAVPKAIPADVRIRLLKWMPPANYGRVFDPATVPAWAMPMYSLAVAVAAGPWVLPVLRSPSWRAAA